MELTVTTFTTIDGVMQGPGAADEDPSNGFEHGGWLVPFADADMGTTMSAWFERAGEILIGRHTYDKMFPYWSQVTDPDDVIARQLNNLPKHIVSRSLQSPEWRHSSVISGDVVDAVKTLKGKPGGELQVHGSAQLVQTLSEHGLVDEYRLLGLSRRPRHRQATLRRSNPADCLPDGGLPDHQHRRGRADATTGRCSGHGRLHRHRRRRHPRELTDTDRTTQSKETTMTGFSQRQRVTAPLHT